VIISRCAAVGALFAAAAFAQNLSEFEKHVTEFTLDNGMHFIVVERHQAPVVSFHTYVNAGAVDDPQGETGMAHMFEHMAFKGTAEIGSKNWAEEQRAIAAIETVYDQLDAERAKGPLADPARVAALKSDLQTAIEKAETFVDTNLYPRIIEENGGEGLNASTGEDSTNFFYSLPSNRAELWFLLESARFKAPVYREFYKERAVVREERRMRTESEPQGKLIEALGATAIEAHPYRRPAVGWPSDIENLRVTEAEKFFHTYYVPADITISIVGDIDPAAARRFADHYFAPLPKGPLPPRPTTVEPEQQGPKSAEVESASQPIEFIAYKRASQYDKNDPVYDVISSILSSGRTGLLYKSLVRDSRAALAAGAESSYPGSKYPNLFMLYLVPSMGKTLAENEKELYAVLDKLKNEKVDNETLQRVKTRERAALIRQLDGNSGLASLLATYYANFGDWRKLFTQLDEYDKITPDDVQRVARELFTDQNKTVAFLKPPGAPQPPNAPAPASGETR
jgi:predicted Zn-dependent peptidase